jgi:hypothetical protein
MQTLALAIVAAPGSPKCLLRDEVGAGFIGFAAVMALGIWILAPLVAARLLYIFELQPKAYRKSSSDLLAIAY